MLIKTNNFELEISTSSLFIKAFGTECFIYPCRYSAWEYFKDSAAEFELHLGKIEVLISKAVH